jgi:hypothetical protein
VARHAADGGEDVIRVPWPGGQISERRDVRREIVALYDEACARLGITRARTDDPGPSGRPAIPQTTFSLGEP